MLEYQYFPSSMYNHRFIQIIVCALSRLYFRIYVKTYVKRSRFGLLTAPASAYYATAKSGLWRQVEHLKSSTIDFTTTSRRAALLPSKVYHPFSSKRKIIHNLFYFFPLSFSNKGLKITVSRNLLFSYAL